MGYSFFRPKASVVAAAALFTTLFFIQTKPGQADDDRDRPDASRVRRGFAIAPVTLTLRNLDRELVGYGSYLVNAASDCNGCHTSSPQDEYVFGGIPFFGQKPKKVNPAKYLGGSQSFGSLIPGSAEIVTRNLTPDKSGKPAGLTFAEFVKVIRTGVDLDKWHPTCTGAPNAHCIPAPFDGSLLQIMPWPQFQDMVDLDLAAIYSYLSAIPCLEGDPGNPAGSDTKGKRCH
ncbi:MAG: hypothetical protein U0Q16_06135 [Bryobacteraceae bacterium]